MKIQLDTTNKTITLEDSVNLSDLFETLNKILPNDLWKEFKLEILPVNQPFKWPQMDPIIQPLTSPFIGTPNPYPSYPGTIDPTWVISCSNNTNLEQGVFNIEVNLPHKEN